MTRRVVVEADGGSRGNPGAAAWGAVLRDADTGEVLAERGETIGVATNNVAEYSGLIGGLELAREHAPDAGVEVRMDSKLVVEQMAGRWKVKNVDLAALAERARDLAARVVEWRWIPRAENGAADALVNQALDARDDDPPGQVSDDVLAEAPASSEKATNPLLGWRGRLHGEPTTLVLLRHGVTDHTVRKLFCGSGGTDPGLNAEGEAQAVRAAGWISRNVEVDAIVSSPLRRTQETAGFVARELGLDVALEPGVAEAAFGDWDGHSFAEIMDRWPDELQTWLADTAVAPPGGESFDAVYERAVAARHRLLEQYAGQTVVVASHVTPIKMLVREALGAPMSVIHAMELAPASITTIAWWPDATPSLKAFSVVPEADR